MRVCACVQKSDLAVRTPLSVYKMSLGAQTLNERPIWLLALVQRKVWREGGDGR